VAAAWTACTSHLRWGRRLPLVGKCKNKGLQLRLGAFLLLSSSFRYENRTDSVKRAAVGTPQPRARPVLPPRTLPLPQRRPAAGAESAAIQQKAMRQGWKTHSTRNPGKPARPATASSVDGSWCAYCCGKDALPRVSRIRTQIGTSGKPWIHLRNADLPTTTSIAIG
jgi:hypothetical protein